MLKVYRNISLVILAIVLLSGCQPSVSKEENNLTDAGEEVNSILTPVPFNEVKFEDNFWLPRLNTQAKVLLPFALDKTKPAVENLQKAANFLKGVKDELPFTHRYISSDLYKVMEGAAYLLMENRDPALEKQIDDIIDIIAAAQKEDGYLYVAHIAGVANEKKMGKEPYGMVRRSHELYNMGHMYEAAIAYYRATGKDKWLKVAEKNAQHINKVFFEGDPAYNNGLPVNQAPGHEEIELALTKLYRLTDNELYLDMAKKFLDIRGITYRPNGKGTQSPTYAQEHKPVKEQDEAVGHSVRAMYLYSAMADVEALTEGNHYDTALHKIWHNIVDTKMAITGGVGAVRGIEGFGPAYVLPNKEAYNETCAAVGNVFFNYRMFLLHKDARFMDVAEVALFNNVLSGVNMEGNKFFYVNPLEADGISKFNHGKKGRSPWFGTACCPTNLARLIPQVSGLIYAHDNEALYVNLYAGNATTIPLSEGKVAVKQSTHYPFDENITISIDPEVEQQFTLMLRIPGWAGEQFVPGELYNYENKSSRKWQVKVNGQEVELPLEKGFASINRKWKAGDKVSLHLPMPVRFNTAIDSVEANRGRVAITRGPLVYCAEGTDNSSQVQQYFLAEIPEDSEIQLESIKEGVLKDIVALSVPAKRMDAPQKEEEKLKLIPYYAWNNRGDGDMMVWLPAEKKVVEQ
jgi:DUF1680 family protein